MLEWAIWKTLGGFLKAIPWQAWALAAVLACVGLYGHWRYNAGQAEVQAKFDAYKADVQAKTKAAHDAAKRAEKAQREAFDAIAKQREKEKADAEAMARKLAADLRAGREQLRKHWTCPASEAGATGSTEGADAAARLREESAARIVGAAAEADAWIRALQAILEAERK